MKRYFYTDPVVATWMSKQFGVLYVNDLPRDQQHCFQILGVNQGWSPDSPYEMILSVRTERRFYIHPDSLYLLEPRDGDFVLVEGRSRPMIVLWDGDGGASGSSILEPTELLGQTLTKSIIQRDGKPFMWPESETA